jgi:hypothetical protein
VAIGDGHSGEGATSHTWDRDVHRMVRRVLIAFPSLTANTYDCHPFCGPAGNRQGWARRSVDVWGPAGRGDPLSEQLAWDVQRFLFDAPLGPPIRHQIVDHSFWLRGAGWLTWSRDDHTGALRHVHTTYLPVPAIA